MPDFLPSSLPTASARRHLVAQATALCCATGALGLVLPARAQSDTRTLEPVVVSGSGSTAASVSGFGLAPAARTPIQTTTVTQAQLQDQGSTSLNGLTRADAAVSDAYNAAGYWSILKVRGYTLDNRSNYRRDGLPINAETTLGLDNKAAVEILKGTSGIQAGASAPGGLVNLLVKRPQASQRTATLSWEERGTVGASVDLAERFGTDARHGLRVNAAWQELAPKTASARGRYQLLSVAGDWRISPDHLLEAEIETSHRSQASAPGFSLLGNRLPDAASIDPNTNLNNQTWSLPVVTDGTTASLRWLSQLGGGWSFQAHGMSQQLISQDRLAYAYGCSAEGNWDRYCSDGSFDLYDFRSENERRDTAALDLSVRGGARTGAIGHQLELGVLSTRTSVRLQGQAYNYVGTGTIDASSRTAADPTLGYNNTDRTERSTEFYARDTMDLGADWRLWAGLRHTRLQRESVQTDGSEATAYRQGVTTPWLALSRQLTPQTLAYVSWGQGIESEVVANRPHYSNAGTALPALRSRQTEIGLKYARTGLTGSLSLFDIRRPRAADSGICDSSIDDSCTRVIDGRQRHLGIEASGAVTRGAWTLQASAMALRARIEDSQEATLDDSRPDDVPSRTLKMQLSWRVPQVAGLTLHGTVAHESERVVLPQDNSVRIPGWTTLGLGTRWNLATAAGQLTWRVGVDNLTNRRAWRESPYQYGHAYLFPLAERTWRTSVQMDF